MFIPPLVLSAYPAVLVPEIHFPCIGPAKASALFLNPLPADLTIMILYVLDMVPSMSSSISSSVPLSEPESFNST